MSDSTRRPWPSDAVAETLRALANAGLAWPQWQAALQLPNLVSYLWTVSRGEGYFAPPRDQSVYFGTTFVLPCFRHPACSHFLAGLYSRN